MSAYFLQTSDDNLYKLIGYNLLRLIVLCIFFVLLSGIAKSRNRLNLIRVSLAACVCFFITLIYLGEKSCNYWWLLAIFWGMSTGMYHCGWNSFEVDNLKGISRGKFLGIYESISYSLKIVIPVIFGYIIDKLGFKVDFIVILGLTVIHAAGLFILKDTYDWKDIKGVNLKFYFNKFKHKEWFKPIFLCRVFSGMSHSCTALDLLASILILKIVVNSTGVGIVASLGYIAASIFGMLFSRLYKREKLIIKWHWIITLLYGASILGLFIGRSEPFILLYYFIGKIYRMSSVTICDTIEGNIAVSNDVDSYSQEYYAWGDIQLLIGRVTGYVILLLYFQFEFVIIAFVIGILLCSYFALKLSQYLNTETEN